VRPTTYE